MKYYVYHIEIISIIFKSACSVSGCTDYFAKTEEEAFEYGRATVEAFNIETIGNTKEFSEPLFDAIELLGIVPRDYRQPIDVHKVCW